MTGQEIETLWEDYLHGQISAPDERRLLAALHKDEKRRGALLDDLALHGVLMQGSVSTEAFIEGFRERLRAEGDGAALVDSVRERMDREADPSGRREAWTGRSRAMTVFPRLAAAAVILAGVGVAIHLGSSRAPEYAIGRITRSVAQVAIADRPMANGPATDIQTGPDSFCRVELADGSAVGVDRQTRMGWQDNGPQRGKAIDLQSGRIYLDLAKQATPFAVRAGDLKGEVLGTRILAARGEEDLLSVLKGSVRVSCGESSTFLYGGQTAVTKPGFVVGNIFVHSRPPEPASLSWIDRIGFDSRTAGIGAGDAEWKAGDGPIDVGNYRLFQGAWRIERRSGKLVISQESGTLATDRAVGTPNIIILGESCWQKGVFSARCRVRGPLAPDSVVALAAGWTNGMIEVLGTRRLAEFLKEDPVLAMRMEFEVDAVSGTFQAKRFEFWPVSRPDLKWTVKDHQGVRGHGPCAIGLGTQSCMAEFTDLSLTDAVRAEPAVRGELRPWVADYYKRHDQFVLQRETFTDGEVSAVLTPAQLKDTGGEGEAQVKVVRHIMKDGKERDALLIDNTGMAYYVTKLRFPGGLPDAFAVEVDILALQVVPPPAGTPAGLPFWFEGRPEAGDTRSRVVDVPGVPTSPGAEGSKAKSPKMALGEWGQFRAEYLRIGDLATGESLWEVRMPRITGGGTTTGWKREEAIVLSLRGIKILLGEARLLRLVPPAGLGAEPALR